MDVLDAILSRDAAIETARKEGKNDPYCKAQSSFIIAELSDGTVDYFPYDQPPHRVEGGSLVVERDADILERWRFSGKRWREI